MWRRLSRRSSWGTCQRPLMIELSSRSDMVMYFVKVQLMIHCDPQYWTPGSKPCEGHCRRAPSSGENPKHPLPLPLITKMPPCFQLITKYLDRSSSPMELKWSTPRTESKAASLNFEIWSFKNEETFCFRDIVDELEEGETDLEASLKEAYRYSWIYHPTV